MRKHAVTPLPFTATTLRDFSTTNRPKKLAKSSSLTQQSEVIKTSQTSLSSTRVKSLAWDAYKNELEFE